MSDDTTSHAEIRPNGNTKSRLVNTAQDLGAPVLLEGEAHEAYTELLQKVTAAVEPADIIEEFWVRDVVDLLWETLRLRRLKTALLASSALREFEAVLTPALGTTKAPEWPRRWYAGEEGAVEMVDVYLKKLGLTRDGVFAQTLSAKLDDIERIDRLIASAEGRRHVVIREIDRRRSSVAARLRAAAERIQDAEFAEVEDADQPQLTAV